MNEHKRKFRQDFTRCCGKNCKHKDDCLRAEAYQEAQDLDLSYGHYIQAKDCIENSHSEIVTSKGDGFKWGLS